MNKQDYSAEWLETNQLGSYASSSVALIHTRKYHGWLVGRWKQEYYVWLNKIEEIIQDGGHLHVLTGAHYRNAIFPVLTLERFTYDPYPHWEYQFGDFKIIKELILVHNANTLLLSYRLVSKTFKQVKLTLRPMFSCRNRHALQLPNSMVGHYFTESDLGFKYEAYPNFPAFWFQSEQPMHLQNKAIWYYDIKYQEELNRGYDGYEALYLPAELELELKDGQEIILSAGLEPQKKIRELWREEQTGRRKNQLGKANWLTKLQRAAKAFVTVDNEIIAGYPWFGVWSRDTMIALPGLTLFNGQEKQALAILQKFANFENQGALPNYLDEQPSYNSVDAALWYIWACSWYYKVTSDHKGIASLLPTIVKIVEAHLNGTKLGVQLRDSGLIYSRSLDNVTWMDAKVDGQVITPRSGYIVELNALWYYALVFLLKQTTLKASLRDKLCTILALFEKNFSLIFWNSQTAYLNDYVTDQKIDNALRPNQLWAVALDLPLSNLQKKKIVNQVKKKLFTPYGLRTLSPDHLNYCGRYLGNQTQRDLAYHNGTVWPWLLGVFTEAVLKIQGSLGFLKEVKKALGQHIEQYGLGGIAEVFDGDEPHLPNGSISQAWSVAEVLRSFKLVDYDKK